jgi:hypothetical protein
MDQVTMVSEWVCQSEVPLVVLFSFSWWCLGWFGFSVVAKPALTSAHTRLTCSSPIMGMSPAGPPHAWSLRSRRSWVSAASNQVDGREG